MHADHFKLQAIFLHLIRAVDIAQSLYSWSPTCYITHSRKTFCLTEAYFQY